MKGPDSKSGRSVLPALGFKSLHLRQASRRILWVRRFRLKTASLCGLPFLLPKKLFAFREALNVGFAGLQARIYFAQKWKNPPKIVAICPESLHFPLQKLFHSFFPLQQPYRNTQGANMYLQLFRNRYVPLLLEYASYAHRF